MLERDTLLQILEQRSDIGGRFINIKRVDNPHGVGAFSALIAADDSVTKKRVAVKVCLPLQDSYRIACFDREADLLKSLRGEPDIIQMISEKAEFTELLTAQAGISFPLHLRYYALELASRDVGDVIASGAWTAVENLIAFRSMCRSVQRVHSRRIAHRDLTPSNFLVMSDGSTKLSDFGTARRLNPTTASLVDSYTGPPGDRRYCAPEMLACLHGEDPSIAVGADIFSLGAILFEMFSGTNLGLRLFTPLFWDDIAQVMVAVRQGQRRKTYDQIITSIANSRPLPSVASFGAPVPGCVRDRIDDLYQYLSAIDYRRRPTKFNRTFNKLNTCLLILRNEAKYQRWLANKKSRLRAVHARFLSEVTS